MECECLIDSGNLGDEYATVLSESTPTARKQHICCECGGVINKGEKYSLEKYVAGGQIYNHKMCQSCREIRDVLFCSWRFGGLVDDLIYGIQTYDGIPEDCIAKLSAKTRDIVCDMIEDFGN